jgi:uncharacterized membrane protein
VVSSEKKGILIVVCCSICGTVAQLLFKKASNDINQFGQPFFYGYLCLCMAYLFYGLSTLLLISALRKGRLSVLYPFVALTFAWVTILSPLIFRSDSYNLVRILGVVFIIMGVSLIGWGKGNHAN